MNPLTNPNAGQYADELHYVGEHHLNMNKGSNTMIGVAHKLAHHQIVEAKVISSTALTERREEHGEEIDVTKNYSRLPKSMNQPQPNNAGEPAHAKLYKKDAKPGKAKGGIKYGY